MSSLLYLHGFVSCGKGHKSTALAEHFGKENVFAPDLPYAPDDAIAYLEDLLASRHFDLLVGSSLGGFYATFLAEKYAHKAVLLNPSTEPYETLAPYVGEQRRFCDGETFRFEAAYLQQLKQYVTTPETGEYLVLLQSGDEVLDYRKAEAKYQSQRVIVEYGGNHRFENIEDYLSMIGNFTK